jgi:hypothetical protein
MLAAAGAAPLVLDEPSSASAAAGAAAAWEAFDDPLSPLASTGLVEASSAAGGAQELGGRGQRGSAHAGAEAAGDAAAATPLEGRAAADALGGLEAGRSGSGNPVGPSAAVGGEGPSLLLREYAAALLEALGEVFALELRAGDPAELVRLAE